MRIFFGIIFLALLAYLAGFLVFLARLPMAPDHPHADAIVALTGGDARLDTAVALLEQGAGQRLLISGVDLETNKETLGHMAQGGRRFACCADLGYAAEDTSGNAQEAAEWAHEHGYRSLIVVTARYHMPRAMLEFRTAMPAMALIAYPVENGSVDVTGWWRHQGTTVLLQREYMKYLATLTVTQIKRVPMIFLRSLLFLVWMLGVTLVEGVLALPLLLAPRRTVARFCRFWAQSLLWGLKVLAGIDMRITGTVPSGPVLVAAKHMSMWDTLAIYVVLGDPGTILKRSLLYVPFFGWYLGRSTAIAIDRGAGASALRAMAKAANNVLAEGRPVVIFPEGTRHKPGTPPDYKPGVAGLYGLLDVPCVPVALDSGRYWQGFWKRPGTITLAFLEPVPPGLKRGDFMPILQQRIESATKALLER